MSGWVAERLKAPVLKCAKVRTASSLSVANRWFSSGQRHTLTTFYSTSHRFIGGRIGGRMADDETKPIMDYDAFLKERDDKLELLSQQQKFIDSAVLSLGGGGLGLLLSFLHDLRNPPT